MLQQTSTSGFRCSRALLDVLAAELRRYGDTNRAVTAVFCDN